jgi:hypothetical protein
MSEEGGPPSNRPDHSNPKIKHVTGAAPYTESFEHRCARGQNVCNDKEVLFDVEIGQSAQLSLQVLEACSPVSVDIQIIDDTDKVVNSYKINKELPGTLKHNLTTSILSPVRVYKVIMTAEGGYECNGGYLPRWVGDLMIDQTPIRRNY